jgi:hypothetical protein
MSNGQKYRASVANYLSKVFLLFWFKKKLAAGKTSIFWLIG